MKRTSKISKFLSQLEDMRIAIDEMKDNKQTSFDSKSEKWQDSDKGEEAQEDISNLEELSDSLQSAYDDMENLFEEE